MPIQGQLIPTKEEARRSLEAIRETLKGEGVVTEGNIRQLRAHLQTMGDFKSADPIAWRAVLAEAEISEPENAMITAKLRQGGPINNKFHAVETPQECPLDLGALFMMILSDPLSIVKVIGDRLHSLGTTRAEVEDAGAAKAPGSRMPARPSLLPGTGR